MDVKKFFKLFKPRRNAYFFEHGANLVRHSKPLTQLWLSQFDAEEFLKKHPFEVSIREA